MLVTPFLPAAPWWSALIDRGSPVDITLEVYQLVHGQIRWAREETSLTFHCLSF